MLEAKIYAHLSTYATVTAFTSSRIFPVTLPEGTAAAFPALTYQRVSANREYGLNGYHTLEQARIQIDCWSTSYETSKNMAAAVKTAMDAATTFKSVLSNDMDLYEDLIGIYRVTQDFTIFNRE